MIKKLYLLLSLGIVANALPTVDVAAPAVEVQQPVAQDISHPVVLNADEDPVESASSVEEAKVPESPIRDDDSVAAASPGATVLDPAKIVPQQRSVDMVRLRGVRTIAA